MFSTIRNQLILAGALASGLILLLAVTALYALLHVQGAVEVALVDARTIRIHLQGDMMHDALRADVLAAQIAARSSDAAGLAQAAKEVDEHAKEFLDGFATNLATARATEVTAELQRLDPLVKQYCALARAVVGGFASSPAESERRVPTFLAQFEDLEGKLDHAREVIERVLAQTERQSASSSRFAMLIVAVTATLTLLLAVAAAVALFRRVALPLGALRGVADRVNGGDMQARAQMERKDELGDFARAFDKLLDERIAALNEMAQENERLNHSVISVLQAVSRLSERDLTVRAPVTDDVIGTVSDSINSLTEATSQVLAGVNRIAGDVASASDRVRSQGALVTSSATDERQDVMQMAQSLQGATSTMKQVAALAEQSNRSAEQATEVTNAALATVNSTVKGMQSIREIIAEAEKRIKRLGERSMEISGIVNLINTISERTHVLALNASMQAAVAGEAGRGFAVVAEEVQRLAESSRAATQQIATLVQNIQLETNETISTVNRTIDQVVQGSEHAQKAGEQMRRTQEITGELVAQVRHIAQASSQQMQTSERLLEAVQRIGLSNERTFQQIDAQNRETVTLQESARRLVESVSVFKLPQAAA
jgi:methyl-accepting chemotaxis protein